MNDSTPLPQLSLSEALKEATSKVTQFTGRARRSEYWWTYLVVFILNLLLSWTPILGGIVSFVLGLAMIPLTFRRLHDTGRSGWWWGAGCIIAFIATMIFIFSLAGAIVIGANGNVDEMLAAMFSGAGLIMLIPIVYGIVMLVFMCQDSQPFENKYGPSPKYKDTDENNGRF